MEININELATALVCSVASGSVAVTISSSKLFKPLRDILQIKAEMAGSFKINWLSNLIHCYYCLGHYTTLFFLFLVKPLIISGVHEIIAVIVTIFFCIGITNFFSAVLLIRMSTYNKLSDN